MSHFAEIDSKGRVVRVLVVEQEFIDSGALGKPTKWIQTSYNTQAGEHRLNGTPLRKNYAGIGYTYDKIRDAFIPPKPYDSWLLNEDSCQWYSPVPYPADNKDYIWDESSLKWKLVE